MQGSLVTMRAQTAAGATSERRITRVLALGALAGPILFTTAWIYFGLLRPAVMTPYGVVGGIWGTITNPISGLGVGPNATQFNAAFVVCGVLQTIGCVAALACLATGRPARRVAVTAGLLAVSPMCLTLVGFFTLESALLAHIVLGTLLFLTPVISLPLTGRLLEGGPDLRPLATALLIAGPVTLVLLIVYSISFNQATAAAGLGVAGLTERILMLEVQAWYVVLGWVAFARR
jgi:hypothetical membrane protein